MALRLRAAALRAVPAAVARRARAPRQRLRPQHTASQCHLPRRMHAAAAVAAAGTLTGLIGCGLAACQGAGPSPWHDPELLAGLPARFSAEQRLRLYLQGAAAKAAQLRELHLHEKAGEGGGEARAADRAFERRMEALREEVAQDTQVILYGVREPHARQRYVNAYGCAKWTAEALDVLAAHGPLIEIGAGGGQWQRALAARGCDILAFDNQATLQPTTSPVGQVQSGDEGAIQAHPSRRLFVCYPPDDDMAAKCLRLYRGDVFLYVGEARGGVNGNEAFFSELERDWTLERVVDLDPFPQCFERLWVFTRTSRG